TQCSRSRQSRRSCDALRASPERRSPRAHPKTGGNHGQADDIKRHESSSEDQGRGPERVVPGNSLRDEGAAAAVAPIVASGAAAAPQRTTDSHLVWATFNAGWLTRTCQITAQSPSVWGVMRSG